MNFYIPHNRRTPLQAEEALGPISIPRGSRGVQRNQMIPEYLSLQAQTLKDLSACQLELSTLSLIIMFVGEKLINSNSFDKYLKCTIRYV